MCGCWRWSTWASLLYAVQFDAQFLHLFPVVSSILLQLLLEKINLVKDLTHTFPPACHSSCLTRLKLVAKTSEQTNCYKVKRETDWAHVLFVPHTYANTYVTTLMKSLSYLNPQCDKYLRTRIRSYILQNFFKLRTLPEAARILTKHNVTYICKILERTQLVTNNDKQMFSLRTNSYAMLTAWVSSTWSIVS